MKNAIFCTRRNPLFRETALSEHFAVFGHSGADRGEQIAHDCGIHAAAQGALLYFTSQQCPAA